MKLLLLSLLGIIIGLSGCASYQNTVASRSDALSGYSKDGNYGGEVTHTVVYR